MPHPRPLVDSSPYPEAIPTPLGIAYLTDIYLDRVGPLYAIERRPGDIQHLTYHVVKTLHNAFLKENFTDLTTNETRLS